MNKKEFLDNLEKELKKLNVQDSQNILEYYDEFIEDQKESGKKEKDIISKINMDDIRKEVKIHKKINDATERPSLSTGIKALIAFLGILSLPMLLAVGGILFAIVVTALALIFALFVTVGALLFASGASIVAFIWGVGSGTIGIAPALFGIGWALVFLGLFALLLKWTINVSREIITWGADLLKRELNKRRGGKNND